VNGRVAFAVVGLCAAGVLRTEAEAAVPSIDAMARPCARRVQIFDGVASILACDPAGADSCDGFAEADGDRRTPNGATRMAGPALRLLGLKVDVNRASMEDLEALPGVGPKMAERLMEVRAARPFRSVDDLREVAGIGPKRFAQLEGVVTVDPVGRRFCADHL
jgi:competence ComEA-like helix-hairpin-helix protein